MEYFFYFLESGIDLKQLIIFIIAGICLWLLLREVRTWYWRINEIERNQELQVELMDEIISEIRYTNKLLERSKEETSAEPTEEPNNESTP